MGLRASAALEDRPRQGEEPRHGIAGLGEGPGEQRRHLAVDPAEQTPALVGARPGDVAAADGEVRPRRQALQQRRDGLGRVAQVGVHAHQHLALGPAEALQDRRAEPALAHARDQADGQPLGRQLGDHLVAAVAAVVVDDDHLPRPVQRGHHLADPVDQRAEVLGLAVGRHDDRYPVSRAVEMADDGIGDLPATALTVSARRC